MRLVSSNHLARLPLLLAALSWAWMLGHALTSDRMTCCQPRSTALEELIGWGGMAVAMMLPTTLESAKSVAARSYRSRRLRAVLGYLLGYLSCWAVLGVPLLALRQLGVLHEMPAATALCVFAALWALLPERERWHRLAHRQIVLCPLGWRADRDAFKQGAVQGWPCVALCWPLMFACAITGHNLVLMVAGTALTVFEKRMFRLRRKPLVIAAMLMAAWTLVIGLG
jgi:predicted metal-binding membrane protein